MTLKLHEELLLLALREREGTTHWGVWPTAVGAALLAELVAAGRVALRPGYGCGSISPGLQVLANHGSSGP